MSEGAISVELEEALDRMEDATATWYISRGESGEKEARSLKLAARSSLKAIFSKIVQENELLKKQLQERLG